VITFVEGDLFDMDLPALGHGCNCQGVMGRGIAVVFKNRYPEMYKVYQDACENLEYQLGDVFVWGPPDQTPGEPVIYNLATQPTPGPTASLEAIQSSLTDALEDAKERGIDKIGIPRIGAGLGGLKWEDVSVALAMVADPSPVELVVVSLPESK
jgi:O-acetyl-ADP-ribose deacetylase (regulator of RNase III)